ncbi:BCD family MFS transporter [Tropicimonas sp. IMCC34043]|uniref:BCD family MFS transporter n=1 Tax=Tropicimonas sp. IMCC34043 TaxID=2248760 RepID=UPI000E25E2B7|nr:BCD family MFS transporter [Tropicimonas sp. IMCC34043]
MSLSWLSIVRLGLVQMCLGAIIVLTTSTLNRLMVVELALPAIIPGFLVALHYGIQITRPSWGYRSDTGGQRTPWIIGGIAALAVGALLASTAISVFETRYAAGLALSIFAYALIGLGAGAGGTSLLALLATATDPMRRAAAATITWLMMIFGIAATAGTVGQFLDPYSHALLMKIVGVLTLGALLVTVLATWGIERRCALPERPEEDPAPLLEGLREIWAEPRARNFTLFVFLSMTAYFMQELILEPYAGLVFGFTPGQTTSLSGAQNGGVFLGMITVGICASWLRIGSLQLWVILGCLGSAAALVLIASLGRTGPGAPLLPAVIAMGYFNGVFAVAAIAAMMQLAGEGRSQREGSRMGLWGAAQAIAAGFGGLAGAAAADVLRLAFEDSASAFGTVFLVEATLFVASAAMARQVITSARPTAIAATIVPGE